MAIQLTGANRNDSQQALALVDAIPFLQRDNADDPAVVLIACWATAVMMLRRSGKVCVADASSLFLAKRNTEHGSGLGQWRWVVERTFAWLNQFRRLRVRYEKRADIHEAFLSLGVCTDLLALPASRLGGGLKS